MTIAILLLIICQVFGVITGVWYVKRRIQHGREDIIALYNDARTSFDSITGKALDTYNEFITPPDKETPSPLEIFLDSAAQIAGQRLITMIQSRTMADASHISRQEKLLEEDMLKDAIAARSPMAAMFLQLFPSAGKRILKNKSALQAALPLIESLSEQKHLDNGNGVNNDWVSKL